MAKNSRRQDPTPVRPETEPWTMPNTQTAFSKAERHRELLAKAREAVPLATAERYVRNSISYWDLVVMAEYDRLRAVEKAAAAYVYTDAGDPQIADRYEELEALIRAGEST